MNDDEYIPHMLDTAESWLGGPYWCLCGALIGRTEHKQITFKEARA